MVEDVGSESMPRLGQNSLLQKLMAGMCYFLLQTAPF